MKHLSQLIQLVEESRKAFLQELSELSIPQEEFKPDPNSWSMKEICEHMVWAERIGVMGMWKAYEMRKLGTPIWEGDNPNQGLSIEEVVTKTWKEKEEVPTVAAPKWGGPLPFWKASLKACSAPLAALGEVLKKEKLGEIIYPHPISGPLNVDQRLQFLRFHLDRHKTQIQRIKSDWQFPK